MAGRFMSGQVVARSIAAGGVGMEAGVGKCPSPENATRLSVVKCQNEGPTCTVLGLLVWNPKSRNKADLLAGK